MSTQNLTANGKIALAPTYQLTPAHRDDSGNVHVYVAGLNTWRLVNESAHLFRPDATPATDPDAALKAKHSTRCVEMGWWLLHELDDGESCETADDVATTPAPAESAPYTPPATWHPGRCYCAVFAGSHHVPGMRQVGLYGAVCKGDQVAPHDASTCPACLAGATDGPPPASARRAATGYGTYAVLSAEYHRNGVSGLGFFVGFVRGLDGEHAGRILQVTTLLSRDGEATEYDAIPVFVTDPTDPTQKFRGDNFVDVAWAVVDTVDDQWEARMNELAARNANR